MVLVETFLQVYERNKTHALFEWFNDLAKEYSGNVNGQLNAEEQYMQVSDSTNSLTTLMETQQ